MATSSKTFWLKEISCKASPAISLRRKGPPLNWSGTENIRWKSPLPGTGWSSPATDNSASLRLLTLDANTEV